MASIACALALAEATQLWIGLNLLGEGVPWAVALRMTAPSWLILLFLALPLVRWLDARARAGTTDVRTSPLRVLGVHLPVAVAFAGAHLLGSAAVAEWLWPDPLGLRGHVLRLTSAYFVVDAVTYAAIVGAHAAWRRRRDEMEGDLRTAWRSAQRSEERRLGLERRIHPDFFFNTLNAVSALVARGDRDSASTALDAFASLMRAALTPDGSGWSMRDELEVVTEYGRIQAARYPGRVRVRAEASTGSGHVRVEPLQLLSPVELQVSEAIAGGRWIDVQVGLGADGRPDVAVAEGNAGQGLPVGWPGARVPPGSGVPGAAESEPARHRRTMEERG